MGCALVLATRRYQIQPRISDYIFPLLFNYQAFGSVVLQAPHRNGEQGTVPNLQHCRDRLLHFCGLVLHCLFASQHLPVLVSPLFLDSLHCIDLP